MKRLPVLALALSLPAWPGPGGSSLSPEKKTDYQAPQAISIGDISYPPDSIASGTVVLRVSVSATGEVTSVRPVRKIASLTDTAVAAAEGMKFTPAKLDGKPIASESNVAITFDPAVNFPTDVPLPPLEEEQPAKDVRYIPADVSFASFSKFPVNSIVFGTIAFEANITPGGELGKVRVLRDIVSLTVTGQAALKKWKFTPAQFDGQPAAGRIVVAFVCRLPP